MAASGLQHNVAGALAYVTIIPAIIFLVLEPYNRNRFVRFHAFQSLFWGIAVFAMHIVVSVIPFFVSWTLHELISLAWLVVAIICALKAYGNQTFKLPVIGDIAEKQAGA